MYEVSYRVFLPARPAGLRSIQILVFANFGSPERRKSLFYNEFFYATKSQYFSIGRTITLIRVLSCGISAVVADLF
jgi:hypothetical protein